jgi:hypothetical protein
MNLYSLEPVAKYLKESHSHLGIAAASYRHVKTNFLASPFSEYEERKRRFNEEYQGHLRSDVSRLKRPVSRTPEPSLHYSPKLPDPSISRPFPEKLSPQVRGLSSDRVGSLRQDSNIFARQTIQDKSPAKYVPVKTKELPSGQPHVSRSRLRHSPEPAEEYFPYGRPGAGAPYRDSSGRPIGDRKLFAEHAKVIMSSPVGYREISPERSYYAEDRLTKDRQQEEMRRALQEQIEQRKVREEEARRKRLQLERQEEERIQRQLREIDSDIRREVMEGEMSRTLEDPPPNYIVPQKSVRAIGRKSPDYKQTVFRRQPAGSPSPQRVDKFDAYRLRTLADKQTESIQGMIGQLKGDLREGRNHAWQAQKDFESIKESLNFSSFDSHQKSPDNSYKSTASHQWSPINSKTEHLTRAGNSLREGPLASYKTFEGWGSGRPVIIEKDYKGVESPEARLQLSKLDELLKTTLDAPQFVDEEFERAEGEEGIEGV